MKHGRVVAIAVGLGAATLFIQNDDCREAWIQYGITIGQCPDGTVRQTGALYADGLRRDRCRSTRPRASTCSRIARSTSPATRCSSAPSC